MSLRLECPHEVPVDRVEGAFRGLCQQHHMPTPSGGLRPPECMGHSCQVLACLRAVRRVGSFAGAHKLSLKYDGSVAPSVFCSGFGSFDDPVWAFSQAFRGTCCTVAPCLRLRVRLVAKSPLVQRRAAILGIVPALTGLRRPLNLCPLCEPHGSGRLPLSRCFRLRR